MTNAYNKIQDSTINYYIDEVLYSMKIGILAIRSDFSIYKMNMTIMNIFGYKQNYIQDRSIEILFLSDAYKILYLHMQNASLTNNVPSERFRLNGLHQNNDIIPLEIIIFKSVDDINCKFILMIQDISEMKENVEDLKYLAYYDQLTKIPNRTLFRDRSETAIRVATREDERIAIMYIDIDEFKVINDTMGHEAGDILLKELSQRFQACVRDSDTVSRVGGDEFAILILKISCLEDVSIVAERILASNIIPVTINDKEITPQTSLGISIFPQDGDNIDILLKNADSAMYCAKGNGKNQYVYYNPNMINEIKE